MYWDSKSLSIYLSLFVKKAQNTLWQSEQMKSGQLVHEIKSRTDDAFPTALPTNSCLARERSGYDTCSGQSVVHETQSSATVCRCPPQTEARRKSARLSELSCLSSVGTGSDRMSSCRTRPRQTCVFAAQTNNR